MSYIFIEVSWYSLNTFNLTLQALEISEGSPEVDCNSIDEVANFSLAQYTSHRTGGVSDYIANVMSVAEFYSVMKLLEDLRPVSIVSYEGKDAWVKALIPQNLHAPICNEASLQCCN